MTDNTQELDEIERVVRSVLTPNSYIVPEEGVQLTKALLDWHNKQIEVVLDRLESMAAYDPSGTSLVINPREIQAERAKIKEVK